MYTYTISLDTARKIRRAYIIVGYSALKKGIPGMFPEIVVNRYNDLMYSLEDAADDAEDDGQDLVRIELSSHADLGAMIIGLHNCMALMAGRSMQVMGYDGIDWIGDLIYDTKQVRKQMMEDYDRDTSNPYVP